MTPKRRIFYGLTLLTGLCLSSVLIFVYPENTIFIQKIRMAVLYGILCPIALIGFRTQKIPNKLLLLTCVIWVFSVMAELVKNTERVFPDVKNERSVLHIDHLCEFVRLMIENEESGVFFPQDADYAGTSCLVRMIAAAHGKKYLTEREIP